MIIVKLQGGLGNQMFQYALGRRLSLKYKRVLKFDLSFLLDRTPRDHFVFRDFDLSIFNLKVEIASRRNVLPFLINKNIHLIENKNIQKKYSNYIYYPEHNYKYDQDVFKLSKVYLDGYWQSPKYFSEIENIIKTEFSIETKLLINSKKILTDISKNQSVCLNVRRTDYVDFPSTNFFHGVLGNDYFYNAVKLLKIKKGNIKIFVFSDDINWCENNLKFDAPTFYVGHEHAGNKFGNYFQLMSACKHFIIPNSTFGWWAAWKGQSVDKVVISPKHWFRSEAIDTTDLIPQNWIRI